MNRAQATAHQRAGEFIEAYGRGDTSKQIAAMMGWNTTRPSQMVNNYAKRLRARGYQLPGRGMKK